MKAALLLFGLCFIQACSVVKKTGCSKKYVTVVVVSKAGYQTIKVPYCDTIYIGGKPQPDSMQVKYILK